jgi:hypothetical protein
MNLKKSNIYLCTVLQTYSSSRTLLVMRNHAFFCVTHCTAKIMCLILHNKFVAGFIFLIGKVVRNDIFFPNLKNCCLIHSLRGYRKNISFTILKNIFRRSTLYIGLHYSISRTTGHTTVGTRSSSSSFC